MSAGRQGTRPTGPLTCRGSLPPRGGSRPGQPPPPHPRRGGPGAARGGAPARPPACAARGVGHLAARRGLPAARSSAEAAELLALAQTVLGGADTPAAVLEHLTATRGGRAELVERVGQQWVRVAVSGNAPPGAATVRVEARPGPELGISAQSRQVT